MKEPQPQVYLSLCWNNYRNTFCNVISNLRKKERFSDVTLACAGQYYPVHKLILAVCSDYFDSMLEMTPCKHPVIVIKDIRPQELEVLLTFMYKGVANVLKSNMGRLMKAAKVLRIKGLAVIDDPVASVIVTSQKSERIVDPLAQDSSLIHPLVTTEIREKPVILETKVEEKQTVQSDNWEEDHADDPGNPDDVDNPDDADNEPNNDPLSHPASQPDMDSTSRMSSAAQEADVDSKQGIIKARSISEIEDGALISVPIRVETSAHSEYSEEGEEMVCENPSSEPLSEAVSQTFGTSGDIQQWLEMGDINNGNLTIIEALHPDTNITEEPHSMVGDSFSTDIMNKEQIFHTMQNVNMTPTKSSQIPGVNSDSIKKSRTYLQKWREVWKADPRFAGWLRKSTRSEYRAYCKNCRCDITCGKSEMLRHWQSAKHKRLTQIHEQELEEMKNRPKVEKKIYAQGWRDEWLTEPQFSGWLSRSQADETKAFCLICDRSLTCGRSEILRHGATQKHRKLSLKVQVVRVDYNLDQEIPCSSGEVLGHVQPMEMATDQNGDGIELQEPTIEFIQPMLPPKNIKTEFIKTGTGMLPRKKIKTERGSPGKKKMYAQKWRESWLMEPQFAGWLARSSVLPSKAYCKVCATAITCGRSEIIRHSTSMKHKRLHMKETAGHRSIEIPVSEPITAENETIYSYQY